MDTLELHTLQHQQKYYSAEYWYMNFIKTGRNNLSERPLVEKIWLKKEKLDEVRDFHNGIAGKYDELLEKNRFSVILRSLFQKTLSEYEPGGKTVLDLGCGTGDDALFLSEKGAVVTAVDISQNMLDAALNKSRSLKNGDNISFLNCDLENYLLNTDTEFDMVISNFDAVNYVKDIAAFSNGAARALKPRGSLIVTMLNKVSIAEFFYNLMTFRFSRTYWALVSCFYDLGNI